MRCGRGKAKQVLCSKSTAPDLVQLCAHSSWKAPSHVYDCFRIQDQVYWLFKNDRNKERGTSLILPWVMPCKVAMLIVFVFVDDGNMDSE